MIARVFIDTNVLVYPYDRASPDKQMAARVLLARLVRARAGVISAQVLAEFFMTITRKLKAPVAFERAERRVINLSRTMDVVPTTDLIVQEAIRGTSQHQFHFWDAMIWAAARLNQAPLLLSEDFQDGAFIEGVRIKNPFASGFRLEDWLS